MFKIGEFSKLVRVSPRMLRHYEKCGLLFPAEIDKYTGYRQYSAKQIPLLGKIVTLRDMGFSIEEISDILPNFDDPAYMNRILSAKTAAVKSTIKAEQEKLNMLMEMSGTVRKERNIVIYDIEMKKLPAVKVLSLRGIIPKYQEEGILWEKLGRFVGENQIACHQGVYSTYFDEEYKESNPDIEVAIPVNVLGESQGEFIYKEYEEIPLAATVRFTGPFDGGYDAACEKLAEWMEKNEYIFAGPLRGHIITSPDEDKNPGNWAAEMQAPVVKK